MLISGDTVCQIGWASCAIARCEISAAFSKPKAPLPASARPESPTAWLRAAWITCSPPPFCATVLCTGTPVNETIARGNAARGTAPSETRRAPGRVSPWGADAIRRHLSTGPPCAACAAGGRIIWYTPGVRLNRPQNTFAALQSELRCRLIGSFPTWNPGKTPTWRSARNGYNANGAGGSSIRSAPLIRTASTRTPAPASALWDGPSGMEEGCSPGSSPALSTGFRLARAP